MRLSATLLPAALALTLLSGGSDKTTTASQTQAPSTNPADINNVLVNAMLVGLIRSDQWDRRYDAAKAAGSNEDYEDFIAKLGANVPMKRLGTAEEFANLACFLASDQGGYITGTAINVDGGSSPVV